MKFCVRFPKGFMIPWIFSSVNGLAVQSHCHQTLAFVRELKERGIPVYLLSNAPTYFADYMKDHEILKPFDGILFSAPIHMAKPDQEIYEYFFRKFDLNPSECFFIDDLEKNIQGAKDAGMDGIIFTGDIQAVKDAIDF